MAKLADLIKTFRANIREGNPCEMRYDGETIQLYPIHPENIEENIEVWNRTRCGMVTKPSKKS